MLSDVGQWKDNIATWSLKWFAYLFPTLKTHRLLKSRYLLCFRGHINSSFTAILLSSYTALGIVLFNIPNSRAARKRRLQHLLYVSASIHHLHVSMLTQSTDRVHAMQEPATAPWDLRISHADFEKLRAGFEPQDMDDKWRVLTKNDSNTGTISIHFVRSWTGTELNVLHIKPSDRGSSNSGTRIKDITWEQNKGGIYISEEQAKKEVVLLSRSLLGCGFETLPEYDSSIFWNHPGAQLGANRTNFSSSRK